MNPEIAKRLILGTVQFGMNYGIANTTGQPSTNTINEILNCAFEAGIHTLDTADAYGDSQESIAPTTLPFRILSKFILEDDQRIRPCLMRTLNRLKRPRIYSYSFHRFQDFKEYQGLEPAALKAEGLIEKFGVSLYSDEEFNAAIDTPWIDIIQLPFNLFDNYARRGPLLRKAKDKGKTIHVRSVFLQGLFFKDPSTLTGILTDMAAPVALIQQLAQRNGMSIQQLCLAYALSIPEIESVVVGVDSSAQLISNIESAQTKLPLELLAQINNVAVSNSALLNPANWKSVAT